MMLKRFTAIMIAMTVLAGGILILAANTPERVVPEERVQSDGRSYPLSIIDSVPIAAEIPEGEGLPAVGDMKTLLKLLLDRGALYDASKDEIGGYIRDYPMGAEIAVDVVEEAEAPPPSAPMPSASPGAAAAEPDNGGSHSQTNEQVQGVSEGDIVKTDGRYIYAMSVHGGALRIIRADGAELEVVSLIDNEGVFPEEFYLIGGNMLAIVCSEYIPVVALPGSDDGSAEPEIAIDNCWWYSGGATTLIIYDISDRGAPVETRRISMEGRRISTRVIGSIVYMVTNKNLWLIPYDHADSRYIVPHCLDTAEGEEYMPLDLDRIFYIPETDEASYMLVGAVDVYGDEPIMPTAYLGAGSDLYMSQNAMYITRTRWMNAAGPEARTDRWSPSGLRTDILRFAIDGTDVTYAGMGAAAGSPINQYSMDEYNGFFRIATTDWSAGTFVTVLDVADMSVVGRTEPLAPEERMQSMRFMGNTGYVVTFQNTDPLFTIDLSDPRNPRVMGELEIPGFSQYLHPVGDGLLLGIGRDTQEIYTRDRNGVEIIVGFRDIGMKVSLFDVSDPFNPREIDMLALGEGWADVSVNPRALMCDAVRGVYGFLMDGWDSKGSLTNALILTLENGRLSLASTLGLRHLGFSAGMRLCFIGNYLYLVHNSGVIVYDYRSFDRIYNFEF